MEFVNEKTVEKALFDFRKAFLRIRKSIQKFPKAAMFQLAEDGYNSVFEQLVSCILSIRTLDEVSLPLAKKLFSEAPTPKTLSQMSVEEIDEIISASTFHYAKAHQIQEIARRTVAEYNGVLPARDEVLLSFKGVGPKCAHLVLGIAGNVTRISVDTHVHRVTNRWGLFQTKTPEKTLQKLEQILPSKHWIEINELLVPFGKHICTYQRPKCSTCPILDMCQQIGVHNPR